MDYNITLQEQHDSYTQEPKNTGYTSYTNQQYQQNRQKEQIPEPEQTDLRNNMQYINQEDKPSGFTKFCQLKFYQQYFRVSQLEVSDRIRMSFMPLKGGFVEGLGGNPDFYGPFWLLTTIVFLVSSTGNLSRYFYNWEKDEYIFKLELVRYGVTIVYSFGFGFPTLLYFLLKFVTPSHPNLPQLICLYGYSLSCFIPIFLLCIIPSQILQWLLIAYGTANTTIFLIFNVKNYLLGLEPPKMYIVFGIIVAGQLGLFLMFKLVFFRMVYQGVGGG